MDGASIWPGRVCREQAWYVRFDAALYQVDELRLQLHTDPLSSKIASGEQRGTRARVGVKHHVIRTTGDRDASASQGHRHHCRVIVIFTIAPLRFGRYVPNRSQPALVGTADGIDVVVVVLALGEQEHRLMRLCRSIPNRLRMRVRLVPDDLRAKPPTGILKRESEAPREPDQILGLESFGSYRPHRHGTRPILLVRCAVATIAGRVGVAHVEPHGAVIGEYAVELLEHVHDALQVVIERIVATDLPIHLVVAERPVGRRHDHGLDAPRGEQLHRLARAPTHEHRSVQGNGRARISGVETYVRGAS